MANAGSVCRVGAMRRYTNRRAHLLLVAAEVGGRDEAGAGRSGEDERLPSEFVQHLRAGQPGGETQVNAQMIDVIEAEAPEVLVTVTKTPTVAGYLRSLAQACLEGATNPRVRPLLCGVLLIAPSNVLQIEIATPIFSCDGSGTW
jgi:hypothetical protein